jgi:hypothetical protein
VFTRWSHSSLTEIDISSPHLLILLSLKNRQRNCGSICSRTRLLGNGYNALFPKGTKSRRTAAPVSTRQHTLLKHPKIMGLYTQQPNYNHHFIKKVFLTTHILANPSHLQGCIFQWKLVQTMSSQTFLLLLAKFTINSNTAF